MGLCLHSPVQLLSVNNTGPHQWFPSSLSPWSVDTLSSLSDPQHVALFHSRGPSTAHLCSPGRCHGLDIGKTRGRNHGGVHVSDGAVMRKVL